MRGKRKVETVLNAVYYNENDPRTAAWLHAQTGTGLLPGGVVDHRDIRTVEPDDLAGFHAVHLFAGIGGWAQAVALAGWPDRVPILTGSCPCTPFSKANTKRRLTDWKDNDAHLWPDMFRLIEGTDFPVIAGEQVSTPDSLAWFDLVSDDLGRIGYTVGALGTNAASVGAPQSRERLYWAAVRLGHPQLRGFPYLPATAGLETLLRAWQPSMVEWRACLDGRERPVEPGLRVLADGTGATSLALGGAGNAIVPPLAAAFLASLADAIRDAEAV